MTAEGDDPAAGDNDNRGIVVSSSGFPTWENQDGSKEVYLGRNGFYTGVEGNRRSTSGPMETGPLAPHVHTPPRR